MVVAVIDHGVANNGEVVPTLDGSVIGGESFVPKDVDPVTSPTSTKNDDVHGTMVSTMIAGPCFHCSQRRLSDWRTAELFAGLYLPMRPRSDSL